MDIFNKTVAYLCILLFYILSPFSLYSNSNTRTLKISTTHSMPPYSFINKNQKPAGMVIDFWKLWANKNNVKIKFILTSWEKSIDNVKSGKADFHSGLFESEERSKFLIFSDSLFKYTTSVFISNKIKLNSIHDIIKLGVPIAVTKGSYSAERLKKHYKDVKLKLYETFDLLLRNSIKGNELCFIVDHSLAYYYLSKFNALGKFKILSDFVSKNFKAGVKKGNGKLVDFINRGINKLPKKQIENIFGKWIIKKHKLPEWLKKVLIIGGAAILLLFLILQWIILKIKIYKKTLELNQSKKIMDIINKDMREANLTVQSRIDFLEKINKAKDETIKNIASDLTSPLKKIEKTIEKMENEKSTMDLNKIHKEISSLIGRTEKILKVANIENQTYQSTMVKKNLKNIINSLKKEYKAIAEKKNITFKTSIFSGSITSYINEEHFTEIISNLITNAIKFTPPGGEVKITLDRKNIDNEDKCIIKVSDTGIGIKKEKINEIFSFKTAEFETGTSGEWSTGQGLAIVKKFVELAGGYIEVKSTKNKGSTFSVYLPAISQFNTTVDDMEFDVHTGDIFLFKGIEKNAAELFGEYINWTHVAMIVKFPGIDETLLLESTDLQTVIDKKLNKKKTGPQLVSLTERLKTYQTDLFAIRRLKIALTDKMLNKLYDFITRIHKLNFPSDIKIIWRFLKGRILGRLFKSKRKFRDIFCSELIAQAYIEMGLLPKHIEPAAFLPSDFSSRKKLPFLKGAYLASEIFVNLNEEIKQEKKLSKVTG